MLTSVVVDLKGNTIVAVLKSFQPGNWIIFLYHYLAINNINILATNSLSLHFLSHIIVIFICTSNCFLLNYSDNLLIYCVMFSQQNVVHRLAVHEN